MGNKLAKSEYSEYLEVPESPSLARRLPEKSFEVRIVSDAFNFFPSHVCVKMGTKYVKFCEKHQGPVMKKWEYTQILGWGLNKSLRTFSMTFVGKKKIVLSTHECEEMKTSIEEFVDEIVMQLNRRRISRGSGPSAPVSPLGKRRGSAPSDRRA